MTEYDFSALSSFEFETICRDLFQAQFGLPFEMFGGGPDGGIDLRHLSDSTGKTIGQCKHWSDWAALRRHLRDVELPKIRKLDPDRYLLATSLSLTPDRKDKLIEDLSPYVLSASDIYGREDLNGLLATYPDVERRHVKLWLTSTPVLQAVLNNDVLARTEGLLDSLDRQLRLWVPNPSLERAQRILQAKHVVVLSGRPGIGKTMLAGVLLAEHVARGFEPVLVSDDIDEGDRLWSARTPQVFYYDDFLGRVHAGELVLRKNEENRLASFLERVRQSDSNKRLILTTREYVLAEARNRYEVLYREPFDLYSLVLDLETYTRSQRAEILYNHLYFSSLPGDLRAALNEGKAYRRVIDHPNYSPRIIEQAVDLPGVSDLTPPEFVSGLFRTLDDPSTVWSRIYQNLAPPARAILDVLPTLPYEVLLDDLHKAASQLLGPAGLDRVQFEQAVRTLEGTFIVLRRADERPGQTDSHLVTVRDPSVRDFLLTRLSWPAELARSIERAAFFEQCMLLVEMSSSPLEGGPRYRRGTGSFAIDFSLIFDQAMRLRESPTALLRRFVDWQDHSYVRHAPVSAEARLTFLTRVSQRADGRGPAVDPVVEETVARWRGGKGDKDDATVLLKARRSVSDGARSWDELVTEAFDWITSDLAAIDDVEALLEFAAEIPEAFEPRRAAVSDWADEILSIVESDLGWLSSDADDPDSIEHELSRLVAVAEELGFDIEALVDRVVSHRDELWAEHRDPDDRDDDSYRAHTSEDGDDGAIDLMFNSLEH